MKVLLSIEVENVLCDTLDSLWRRTKRSAGITQEYFKSYFAGKKVGYAVKIKA